MAKRLHEVLNVSESVLSNNGILNGFIDLDSRLYVDPPLLKATKIKELKNSYLKFQDHFKNIYILLNHSQQKNDMFWKKAKEMLTFKEKKVMALGYSNNGRDGNGIGPKLAGKITNVANGIIKAGVDDPIIFELIGFLQENVGPDRISDMTISIVYDDLLKYTENKAKKLKLKTFKYNNYNIPFYNQTNEPIIFVPQEILTALPLFQDWSRRDTICEHNVKLRNKVNLIIGETWKEASEIKKEDKLKILLENPELINDCIQKYKSKKPNKYDFVLDPNGEFEWHKKTKIYTSDFPLSLKSKISSVEDVFSIVTKICYKFKDLVENNGLQELFWFKNKLMHERIAQKIFYGISESYCQANNIDLSPEVNSGRGSVDFKFSKGYTARVVVETKYSSNSHLFHGWEKQLEAYAKAEKTDNSVFLVIQTKDSTKNIERVEESAIYLTNHRKIPLLIVVDGRQINSASKLR